jgi:hypothetical protein
MLEKDVVKVAGGLSQFVRGFEGNYSSPGYWYTHAYTDALDYGQRLMKVAAGGQSLGLKAQMLRSDVLSELVNLGGAYAALIPNVGQSIVDDILPLHSVLLNTYSNQQSLQIDASNNMAIYLQQPGNPLESITISKNFLKEFKNDINYSNNWSDLNWINSFFRVTHPYDSSSLVDNSEGFMLVGSFERGLTSEEIKYLRDVFGQSINYSKINVVRGDIRSAGASKVLGDTIYLEDFWGDKAVFQKDGRSLTAHGLILLSHEVTHVWQFQNGGWEYATAALKANFWAAITTGDRNNAYNWRKPHNARLPWSQWNPEEQAKAMEDYNRAIQVVYSYARGVDLKRANEEIIRLTPYVLEVRAKRGAPQSKDYTIAPTPMVP